MLSFIRPDSRFFDDTGQSTEQRIDRAMTVLERFGNSPDTVSEFITRVCKSRDVAFAFIYGSLVNSNRALSEVEDADILIVTRGTKKFVYEWDLPKGAEIRYLRLSEMRDFLKVERRFFSPVFTKEFLALGGILANGLMAIKQSRDLDEMISKARRAFYRIHIRALSQIVENDCRKQIEKDNEIVTGRAAFSPPHKRRYAFYGSDKYITLDEARSVIDRSIESSNILDKKAHAVGKYIIEGMKERAYASQRFRM
jgi:hypothetical protein